MQPLSTFFVTFIITLTMRLPQAFAGIYEFVEHDTGEIFIVDTDKGTVSYPMDPGDKRPIFHARNAVVTYNGATKVLTWNDTNYEDIQLLVTVKIVGDKVVAEMNRIDSVGSGNPHYSVCERSLATLIP